MLKNGRFHVGPGSKSFQATVMPENKPKQTPPPPHYPLSLVYNGSQTPKHSTKRACREEHSHSKWRNRTAHAFTIPDIQWVCSQNKIHVQPIKLCISDGESTLQVNQRGTWVWVTGLADLTDTVLGEAGLSGDRTNTRLSSFWAIKLLIC